MKAAVLHGNRDLRYEEYPAPVIKHGEVLVKVRAAGICGSDIPRVLHNGAHGYPIVLGHEFSGDVVETGDGTTGLKTGDTVSGAPLLPCMQCADCQKGDYSLCKNYSFIGSRRQGSFADLVLLPERNAVRYDPAIPYEQAAMFEPATVALHGLFCSGYRGGESVAILGGGTIGLFTMQWARIFGAKKTIVFDIDEGRLDLAACLGADAVVNTANPSYREKADELMDRRGFAYVFETAGSPVTMQMAFQLAANKASLCYIGTPRTDVNFTPDLWELMNRKEFHLTGSWMSYSAPFPGKEWELTAHYFATGQLKFDARLIFRRFPMAKAAEAFELFENPAQVHGKVMLFNS
jgi:L-iditol 2-dehydrogenase